MHQFSLAVGATECGAAPVAKRHLLSTGSTSSGGSSSSGAATTTTTKAAAEGFEVPVYAAGQHTRACCFLFPALQPSHAWRTHSDVGPFLWSC